MSIKPKSTYLSDYWTTQDHLNFSIFKPALMDILQNADTPLAVGVFGTWGSGKTSLLRMLEAEIQQKSLTGFRSIWFTAWKYDKQDALWRAFILQVINSLYPQENGVRIPVDKLVDQNQIEGVAYLDRLAESLYQTVTWKGEESWSLSLPQTAKEVVKLPIWLVLHLARLGDAAKDLGLTPDVAELIGREAQTHYMQQLASMEQFEQSFAQALERILGTDGRLVVFVDDLDRCLPEKAVEILEAIKLFLNVPQTVFVLGMDREIVRRGIESYYGIFLRENQEERQELPINGDVYLQKLIQLPFNLPPLNASAREKFIRKLEGQMAGDARLDDMTRQVFARGLLPNPRQVKRALNVYNLLRQIAEAQEAQDLIPRGSIAWPLLAKTVLIQSQWSELYVRWRQYPTLLQTLENAYSQQPITEQEIILGQIANENESSVENLANHQPVLPQRLNQGGLLAPFVNERRKYALLVELLNFPEETGDGRQRARFNGLTRSQLQAYLGLAGASESQPVDAHTVSSPSDLAGELQSGDPAMLREALTRISEQEPERDGPLHQNVKRILLRSAQNPDLTPIERANTADELDRLGYLPDDLYSFEKIDIDQRAVYLGKYPVTNAQYQRFLDADDFAAEIYWLKPPKFSEPNNTGDVKNLGDWGEDGWLWLQKNMVENLKVLPREWRSPRFGIAHTGVPVVGITWYEANAYCRWLLAHWAEQPEAEQNLGWQPTLLRLPTELEWIAAVGGAEPPERYPWDKAGKITERETEVLRHANLRESGIGHTTPVWMYPLGASPKGLWDLSGNVWEWQANYSDKNQDALALRGSSWNGSLSDARLFSRNSLSPHRRWNNLGFRVLALP